MAAELREVAKKLVEGGKGIFAADASPRTLENRFGEMGMEVKDVTERIKYRLMTVATPGLGEYIGGVILHDEAIKAAEVRAAVENEGMMVGIKVDKGTVEMAGFAGEKITEGLDGLLERLSEYREMGARFSKWRAVIGIGPGRPTRGCMEANAMLLSRYAALSQGAGLVPIVEPEVLMEGNQTIEGCQEVTENLGRIVFEKLREQRVDLAGMLYKPNMVVPGKDCATQVDVAEVAKMTVGTMKKIVPVDVPGIVFLSGGQEWNLATARLNAINQAGAGAQWRWTFSFERALEGAAMEAWNGRDENREVAQKALLHRAKMNSLASMGKYTMEMENES